MGCRSTATITTSPIVPEICVRSYPRFLGWPTTYGSVARPCRAVCSYTIWSMRIVLRVFSVVGYVAGALFVLAVLGLFLHRLRVVRAEEGK